MPPSVLTRRDVLSLAPGAALAAPSFLGRDDATPPPSGPMRRLECHLFAFDRSPVPGPHHGSACRHLALDVVPDGRAVLTVTHPDGRPDAVLMVPGELARELDRLLFFVESDAEREKREKRAAGWIDCPFGHHHGRCCEDLCDVHGLVHPDAITAHLGPWITAEAVAAELHRVPGVWGPVVETEVYWPKAEGERLIGTSEDGRIEVVEIQCHGLGWGSGYTPPGELPDGPAIHIWPTHGTHHHPMAPDRPVEWCAYLPGKPIHGGAGSVGEALELAVASIAARLAARLAAGAAA